VLNSKTSTAITESREIVAIIFIQLHCGV